MYVDYNHPNNPCFDDSYLDIEVWKIEVIVDGEVVDEAWKLEDDVERTIRDMEKEYPGCDVRTVAHDLRDCPSKRREQILHYIDDDREDYETVMYYKNCW